MEKGLECEAEIEIQPYSSEQPCAYLSGRNSKTMLLPFYSIANRYEDLLAVGWRRSGSVAYKYACDSCGLCIPLRLKTPISSPTGRLARVTVKNRDLLISSKVAFNVQEHFCLYEKYYISRHCRGRTDPAARESALESFLSLEAEPGDRALQRTSIEYRNTEGRLIAAGYLDILPSGLSSVYFTFDPGEGKRSLGVFSLTAETRYAASLGKPYYYMGFWVPGSRTMDYKADFGPFEIAWRGRWIECADKGSALRLLDSMSR